MRSTLRLCERLTGRREHALPDLLGVVLDPARLRKVLFDLAVATADRLELVVDDEARRPGRPLVDGEEHGRSMPEFRCRQRYAGARMSVVRAVAFDFNGTLSRDEPILYAVYRDMFAERGRPLTEHDYYGTLAGLSEETIIGTWLGAEGPELAALVEERIDRYLALAGRGETVSQGVRDAVSYAADRVPVAVVSGAFRREIEPVLAGAGLRDAVSVIVAADDVENGKPDPAGYLRAVALLGREASEVVAFEDTEAGVASARAAGLYCVGVLGTHPPERLSAADELVQDVAVEVLERLFA